MVLSVRSHHPPYWKGLAAETIVNWLHHVLGWETLNDQFCYSSLLPSLDSDQDSSVWDDASHTKHMSFHLPISINPIYKFPHGEIPRGLSTR